MSRALIARPSEPGPPAVRRSTATGSGLLKWERKNPSPTRKLPMRAFGLKMPPMRMVADPVWANFTGTTEPTDRWSLVAVVVSMSRSPRTRAGAPVPESMRRMTVRGR